MKLVKALLFLVLPSVVFGVHDVSWTFSNSGITSYILDSFEPNDINLGAIGTEDPTIKLQVGKRYQVTVINYVSHPFEVISKGALSTSDIVLLSMKTTLAGSFEDNVEVDWINDGAGTVTFTLTEPLANAMLGDIDHVAGYRCGVHSSNMRGDFIICMSQIFGDLNEDCVVDLTDFATFGLNWLFDFDLADFETFAQNWLFCDFEPQTACP